jgi:hypothetical protein
MYKGVVPFICLQLLGLAIVGFYPALVNYLPNRVYLTSETAPPPQNPRLQLCLEEQLFATYDARGDLLRASMDRFAAVDLSSLPDDMRGDLEDSVESARATFDRVAEVRAAGTALDRLIPNYRPLHQEVRDIQREVFGLREDIAALEQRRRRASGSSTASEQSLADMDARIVEMEAQIATLEERIPQDWEARRAEYLELEQVETKARRDYRRTVDEAYEPVAAAAKLLAGTEVLAGVREQLAGLESVIANDPPGQAQDKIEAVQDLLRQVDGTSAINTPLSKGRRALKDGEAGRGEAAAGLAEALARYDEEVAWRQRAAAEVGPALAEYDAAIRHSIGARLQERLAHDQATTVAACMAHHRDLSLSF